MDIGALKGSLGQDRISSGSEAQLSGTQAIQHQASKALRLRADETEARDAVVSRGEVEKAVSNLQDFVDSVQRNLNFSVDDGSGRVVVKVTDAQSGEVVRQIPSEDALRLAENVSEIRSLLFKAEA